MDVELKLRYLVMAFHKCQIFQLIFGRPKKENWLKCLVRPNLFHNHFANLFLTFIALNIVVFALIIAPGSPWWQS